MMEMQSLKGVHGVIEEVDAGRILFAIDDGRLFMVTAYGYDDPLLEVQQIYVCETCENWYFSEEDRAKHLASRRSKCAALRLAISSERV